MEQLVFGLNGQVHFNSVKERDEAVEYIKNNPDNVDYHVHEDNQNQGARGPEDRIHFKHEDGVPQCLKDIMTAGRPGIWGRINCKEFVDYIKSH